MREKGELDFFSKKERARMEKDYLRLNDYLDGIRDMSNAPVCMFVVDLNKEHIAVAEAKRMGITVVGIADTNVDPEAIDYPIPGNDDAIRSIKLFANLVADAYLEGAKQYQEKIRASGGKPERAEVREERAPRRDSPVAAAAPAGPAVVKVNKGRKLVAAGTAEDVEILMELEQPQAEPEAEADAEKTETDKA
jgi:small subunit ribosomal protein S2